MDSSEDSYLAEIRAQIREAIERARDAIERAEADFLTNRLATDQQASDSSDKSYEKVG